MKIHSLKLTIQDLPNKKGELFAAVYGTLIVDTGEVKVDADDVAVKDEAGDFIPILENINFITPLNSNKQMVSLVQALAVEALTLKDMRVAKKNGQLSHYIETVKGINPRKKKETKTPPPVSRKRPGKKAKKK